MLKNHNSNKILNLFFFRPTKGFHIREISREISLGQPSVINHIKFLLEEGLISKDNKGLYPVYKANRENRYFRIHKKNQTILDLHSSGLIDYLYDTCMPDCIILFGSASRGEDTEESDIDIFLLSPEKPLDLLKYERALGRKISIFFTENFENLSGELKNNVINSIPLRGYLRVYDT
ncbi:MAG: nucleotidyltransferase domain-containing protein, partial [Nanobdellota archaeon]